MCEWSVLLVDDHPLMRKGLAQLLRFDGAFKEITEAENGDKAIDIATQTHFDLIILDLHMKGLSGLETLKKLRKNHCDSVIVVLTVSNSTYDVEHMLAAGCNGYLLKDIDPDEILIQLKYAMQGKQVLSETLRPRSNGLSPFQHLTEREQEILTLVAKGLRNKDIANAAFISEATVKVHLKNILKKLGVSSRVEASLLHLKHVER